MEITKTIQNLKKIVDFFKDNISKPLAGIREKKRQDSY